MGAVMHYNEAAVYLRAQGLDAKWDKASGLTVTLPCKACIYGTPFNDDMSEKITCPDCHGTSKRTLRGGVKYRPDPPRWLWACPDCGGGGETMQPCTCSPQDGFEG